MVRRAGRPSLVLTVLGLSCLLVSLPGQVTRGADLEDFAAPYLGVEPISGEVPLLVVLLGPDDPSDAPTVSAKQIEDMVFGPATVRWPEDIVGMAIAKSNDHCYVWYADGTVSSGSTRNLMSHRPPETYSLASNKSPSDIVGVGIAGTGDRVYAWYRDGTVSVGTSRDLDALVPPYRYETAPGKTPDDIVAIAIRADDRISTWYDDGTVSEGTSADLDAHSPATPYFLPSGTEPSELAGIGLAKDGHAYAWTLDGTVSSGSSVDLDTHRLPYRYSSRQKTVQSYFREVSNDAFTYSDAGVLGWLTATDDPETAEVDESSHDFLYSQDVERKGAWLIQEVERQTPFRFADFDRWPYDGKVTHKELAILWVYPGAGDARGRATSPAVVEVPSLSQGVDIGLLVRGGEGMKWSTIAHELGHQTLKLADLYPGHGISSDGRSWDLDAEKGLHAYAVPAGLSTQQIAAVGIAKSSDRVYTWYRDGTVSIGSSGDLDRYQPPNRFSLPPGLTPGDIVAGAIAGSDDHVYIWYSDGTVSSGSSRDLDEYRPAEPFSLPPGKSVSDIVAVAIAGSDDRVFTWYVDGSVSIGTSKDLDRHRAPYRYETPPGISYGDIADIAISASDTVYAWYRPSYSGAGPYSLMGDQADGSHLDPWAKMKLGWLKPEIVSGDRWYMLPPIETHNHAVILHDPAHGTGEYFMVENRWPPGTHEDNMIDRGLAIWHIDEAYTQSYVDGNKDPGDWGRNTVKLVHAGGDPPLGDRDEALWDASDASTGYSATPISHPSSLTWTDGSPANIGIWFVPEAGPIPQVYLDLPPLSQSLPGSAIRTACTTQLVVLAGEPGEVTAITLTGDGRRLGGATVRLSAEDGEFVGSGSADVSGVTNSIGVFKTTWLAPSVSSASAERDHSVTVTATKSSHDTATASCTMRVLLTPP